MVNYKEGYRPTDRGPVRQSPDKSAALRGLLEVFLPVVNGKRIVDCEPLLEGLSAYRDVHKKTEGGEVPDAARQEMVRKALITNGILDSKDEIRAKMQIEVLQAGYHADENHWNTLLDKRKKQQTILWMRSQTRTKTTVDMV